MTLSLRASATALAVGTLIAISSSMPAAAQAKKAANCVNKAGEGTNSTVDGAKFQAWEAVLQATDWNVWGAMMSSGQKVGNAPGMKVSNLKSSCKAGGLGQVCIIQATLCR